MGNCITKKDDNPSLPIDSLFKLPSQLPTWPSSGGEFGSGYIDLGGLQVCQISTFKKIWTTYEGGPNNLGATIFEPSPIPNGFSILGHYCQPINKPLFGWVLVAKDTNNNGQILMPPSDYTLAWTSESLKIDQNTPAYIWLPVPPEGYRAVGYLVTTSPSKPPVDKIRCVRADFTGECEVENWIWSQGESKETNGFSINSLRPKYRGIKEQGVPVGTFVAIDNSSGDILPSIGCLKNNNFSTLSFMPNLAQIEALFREYSPVVYLHPKETYLPSSVNWYFTNGALLYKKGDESNPVAVDHDGANLPQGGSNDDEYWLDLPADEASKATVKKGDLKTAEVYLHIKPMLGGTFTDIAIWIFYPFNGPATAKLGLIDVPLKRTGQHIGDWEHLTLRISNFTGVLHRMYFSEHSGGAWVDSPDLEFETGNKPVAYASRNGHANYPSPGTVLQGPPGGEIGIRNDTAKGDLFLDCGLRYAVVAAETVVEPPWINYMRKWGPNITYRIGEEVEEIGGLLSGGLKEVFEGLVKALPAELFGEDGPTGPKVKDYWAGDER